MTRFTAVLAAAVLATSAAIPLHDAQAQSFPNRPVTVIVPFPPGGVADLSIRTIHASLERQLKQTIVISNRAGAAGAVGMAAAAAAPADGYTIMCALPSISTIPEVDALFGRTPVFKREQFQPIARLNADPSMLVINASLPWKTLKEMVEDVKKKPGEYVYTSSGIYGASHFPMEQLLHGAGIKMRHLPTNGGGPATNAVLGGHAAGWASPPALASPHLAAGKMRGLVVWGDVRLEEFPDVPSAKELGFDLQYWVWAGLFAPKAVPADTINVLRRAVGEAVKDPEYIAAMKKAQTPIAYMDAPQFQEFWDKDAVRLAEVTKKIGRVEEK